MSDKQRVLHAIKQMTTDAHTTASLKRAAGGNIPQASMRRILNELRVEGHLTRGDKHGTWVPVAGIPTVVDSDTVLVDDVDPLDIGGREDQGEVVIEAADEANLDALVDETDTDPIEEIQ